jgi:hypothetical protein
VFAGRTSTVPAGVLDTSAVLVNADAVGAGVVGIEGDDELVMEFGDDMPLPPQADSVTAPVVTAMSAYERILFMFHLLTVTAREISRLPLPVSAGR